MKTDDMLYSGGSGIRLFLYIKYAENSTEENPTVIARGADENRDYMTEVILWKCSNNSSRI